METVLKKNLFRSMLSNNSQNATWNIFKSRIIAMWIAHLFLLPDVAIRSRVFREAKLQAPGLPNDKLGINDDNMCFPKYEKLEI